MSGTALAASTRWIAKRGKHAGLQVEIIRCTDQAVVVRPIGKNGASWNGTKSQDAGRWTIKTPAFLAGYTPSDSMVAPAVNGTAFRRQAAPAATPVYEPLPYTPATGIVEPRDSGLNIEVTTITPDMAASWLARGGLNRTLADRRVELIAEAIRRGEWRLTGESVKLDVNGCVRDGQHRLQAIVRANVPVQSVVVYGVAEPAFDVMDSGRPRMVADVLGIHGYPSRIALASAARGLMLIEKYGTPFPSVREASLQVSSATTLEYIKAHPDVSDGVRLADHLRTAGIQGGSGLWGTVMTLLLRIDAEQARQFADYLATGADMTAGHPALVLRNRMISADKGTWTSTPGRESLAAMAIKAWNAYRKGKTIQQLTWRGSGPKAESFPVVA